MSQEDLARKAGLSVDAIAALERGRRRAPRQLTVRLLADALGLEPAEQRTFIAASNESGPQLTPRRPPLPPDELVGRAAELDRLAAALTGRARMLTLTGPGGVGKTRLALAGSVAAAPELGGAIAWVPLASVGDAAGVAPAVAAALGVRATGAASADQIVDAIGTQRVLIVLDNCEHVVAATAELAAELLARCPGVRLLATSRELLKVPGEQVMAVPALSVPAGRSRPDRLGAAAIELFVRRSEDRGTRLGDDVLPAVAEIVRRLDGLPLAIELAAARTNVLTVEQIASELAGSFELLADDASIAPARQRTMHGAIGWSFDLLDPDDRRAFAALSVFSGGWTLDAAAAVLSSSRPATLSVLSRLADRSLIRVERDTGEARYVMLAVIREFAAEQLAGSGRLDETAERHAAYTADLLADADRGLRGPEQEVWLGRLDAELENIRGALSWALATGRAELAVRLAGCSWTFCYLRGHYAEGRGWLERALAPVGMEVVGEPVAKALLGAGTLAFLQCEYDAAAARLEQALTAYTELGDDAGTALTLQRLGGIARERAGYDEADRLHRRSLELYTRHGDHSGMAWAHNHLGFVAWLRGDLDTATAECAKARADFEALGDNEGIAWSLISLGVVAQYRDDLTGAEDLLRRSLELSQRLGYREGVAWSLNLLGVIERRRGRTERAVHLLDESLAEHRDLGDRWRTASVIDELAAVAQQRGRSAYAAFLLGASDAIREQIGAPVPACERADRQRTVAAVEAALPGDERAEADRAGRTAPLHAVIDGYPEAATQGTPAT